MKTVKLNSYDKNPISLTVLHFVSEGDQHHSVGLSRWAQPYERTKHKSVTEGDEQNTMPQSLVRILTHIVFSTKNRADLIHPEIESDLYGYINGIVQNNTSKLIAANGTEDHVHLLVSLGKTVSISELIGDIKRDSSKWIKTKNASFRDFHWQEGYGAFSVGQTEVDIVVRYIAEQKEKHQKTGFKAEFRGFLEKYGVEYDERYVWD